MYSIDYSNIGEKCPIGQVRGKNGKCESSNPSKETSFGFKYKYVIYAKLCMLVLFLGVYIILNGDLSNLWKIQKFDIIVTSIFWLVITIIINNPNVGQKYYHYFYLLFMIFFTYFIFFGIVVSIGNDENSINKIFRQFYMGGKIYYIKFGYIILLILLWLVICIIDIVIYHDNKSSFLLDLVSLKKNDESQNKNHKQRILIFLDTGLNYMWFLISLYFIIYLLESLILKKNEKKNGSRVVP